MTQDKEDINEPPVVPEDEGTTRPETRVQVLADAAHTVDQDSGADDSDAEPASDDRHTEVIPGELLDNDEDVLADYDEDTEEIQLINLKIRDLRAALSSKPLPKLQVACFRQNLLTSLDGLELIPENVENIDLYDNRLSHINHLDRFNDNLKSLDLSFNNIKHLKNVSHLTGLTDFFICQNRISKIDGLDTLANLTNLELGGNKIREINNLDKLTNLTQLWLGKNKITKLDGLGSLKKLKILSIQANRITKIEGLENLTELEEFYISDNGIEKIEGLENNKSLTTFDVTSNRISKLENLSHLVNLEEFWASNNQISSFQEVEQQLGSLPALHTVYFQNNPLETQNRVTYRNKVRLALGPSLTQIDAAYIRVPTA